MNAPLEPAHSSFGGSVAARVLHCPASVTLTEKVLGAGTPVARSIVCFDVSVPFDAS
jgi:hypothetical protein